MKNFLLGLLIGAIATAISVQFCPHWKSADAEKVSEQPIRDIFRALDTQPKAEDEN